MKKIYISLLLVLFIFISCMNSSPEKENELIFLEEILSTMEGHSLEESQTFFLEGYEALLPFLSYWVVGEEKETKVYTDEEEKRYEEGPLSISTDILTLNDLKNKLVVEHNPDRSYSMSYVKHMLSEDSTSTYTPTEERQVKSNLSINLENHRPGTASTLDYELKGIYYKDGTYEEISTDDEQRSFSLPHFKLIDSVRVIAKYNYPTKLVSRSISRSNKTAEYNGGKIVLDKIDKNVAKFVIDKSISDNYIECQAKTKSGVIVGTWSMHSSHMSPDDAKKLSSSVEKHLGKIAENIKAEKYKTKEELIEAIMAAGKKIYVPENSNKHVSVSFNGNIDEILLYFVEDKKSEEFELTIPVQEKLFDYNLINDPNTYQPIIVDSQGKKILKVEEGYMPMQLNSYFYAMQKEEEEEYTIYKLDVAARQLTKTEYKYIGHDMVLSSSLLKINKGDYLGAIDNTGNVLIPIVYDNLYKSEPENVIIGNSSKSGQEGYTLYDLSGKKLASGTGYIADFCEGLAIVSRQDDSHSYIDTKGKTVINLPANSWAYNFSDGLAAVKKDEKVGYIDKTGKTVIPFEYTRGNPFYNGIAYVSRDGEHGLINKKNEEVVPLANYGAVIISGSGADATYVFDGNEYDSYGKLVKSDEEEN